MALLDLLTGEGAELAGSVECDRELDDYLAERLVLGLERERDVKPCEAEAVHRTPHARR